MGCVVQFKKPTELKLVEDNTKKVQTITEIDNEMSDELAAMVVEHVLSTSTQPELDKDRVKYIFDAVCYQINNRY